MMMHCCRFVKEDLAQGNGETYHIIDATREHYSL